MFFFKRLIEFEKEFLNVFNCYYFDNQGLSRFKWFWVFRDKYYGVWERVL